MSNSHLLVFLSAPPEIARVEFEAIRREHPESKLTVYVRQSHRDQYEDLLADCFVQSDKPAGSKRAFVRELRGRWFDEAIVLDFGQWSFSPARCLFFLARAQRKTVRTERGVFEFSLWQPLTLLSHLLHRTKNRTGSVAGLPHGVPFPFVFALYRNTIGLWLGVVWCGIEYGWRRMTR
jgi:hypothetical protein